MSRKIYLPGQNCVQVFFAIIILLFILVVY